MLLFIVAVVAANCWAIRDFAQWDMSTAIGGPNGYWYRILHPGFGVIPLIDVALIGASLGAARWLRSILGRPAANPRPSPPGLTYFSLNFLVLGGLACYRFMPEGILGARAVLEFLTDHAARGWSAVFGEPGSTIPWVVVQAAMLGLLVSGPPLLLAWIGHRLARRCAAALPRWRFRAMVGLVSLDFAVAALAICLVPWPFEDEREIGLDFQVIDEPSGRPIPGAFVALTDPFSFDENAAPPRAFADAAGRARLTTLFAVRGERSTFRIMGTFSPWGRWLEVSAEGHRTRRIALTEVLGAEADPTSPPSGTVALARGETPEGSFRDLAGAFMVGGNGFGGSAFTIEPDGRFAWNDWGCTHDTKEYGFLRRRGVEIEPVPVPHPGREVDPSVGLRYRVVAWGDRLFLGLADDRELGDFCRMALGLPVSYGVYRRVSDGDKTPTGLPHLPARVWVTFLADEAGGAAKGARRALGSLVPGILRPRGADGAPSESESPDTLPPLPPSDAVAARGR
jgi:hypothetical protein